MIRTYVSAAFFAALAFLGPSGPAHAQDVTLTSRDGTITISGTLRGFDGEFYRVGTIYGELMLDGQGVVCSGTGCPDLAAYTAEFTFSGAPALGRELLPALVEAYAARRGLHLRRIVQDDKRFRYLLTDPTSGQPLARIGFRLNSTAEGFADLLTHQADIAMAMREATPQEVALSNDAGLGDISAPGRSRIVALDALVPIVARGNPVTHISTSDLARMLAGEITNWSGKDAPIAVHADAAGSGMQRVIRDRLLAPFGLVMSPDAIRHASDAGLSDAVALDPLALGVTRFSQIANAVPVRLRGQCGIELPLSRRDLKTEDYPFTAPLFLYLSAGRLPLFAREFLAWLTTPPAQLVIRRAGFVDQARERIALQDQGIRLASAITNAGTNVPLAEVKRMIAALVGAARLTTTFRFRGGSAKLDAQSVGNVADLARALESGVFDDRQILFVGFSDGEGNWQANQRIAKKRAEAVRKAVRRAAITADPSRLRLTVAGFGEALPVACDDTEWGRGANRRVEVWVR